MHCLRSPKHSKILEDVYFSLWPITKFGFFLLWMVAIVANITKLKKRKTPWLEKWNILLTLEPNVLTFMSFALRFTLSTYPFPKMDGTKGWWFNIVKQIFTSLFWIFIHIFFYIRYITFSFSFLEIPRFASTLSKFENDNFHLNKFPCDEKKFKFQFWQKNHISWNNILKIWKKGVDLLKWTKNIIQGIFFPCFTRM